MRDKIMKDATNAIVNLDKEAALETIKMAEGENISLLDLMDGGFIVGIQKIGELFGTGKVFLPELVLAGDVMQMVTEILNTKMGADSQRKKGRFLIATVKGDVHDIGKGLVASLLSANGMEVIDLGRDVDSETIVEQAVKLDVDIIGTSALLTTTMTRQKDLEILLKKNDLKQKFKTVVGGAPVTARWAKRIGADAYAADAQEAVKISLDLLKPA